MSNNRFHEIQKYFLKVANFEFESQNLNIRNLQITCFKMIYNNVMFCESDIFFGPPENGLNFDNFAKIAHKIAKSK